MDDDVMRRAVEAGARASYAAAHKGLNNCWTWDDLGIDGEHPTARGRYLAAAEAAIRAALPILGAELVNVAKIVGLDEGYDGGNRDVAEFIATQQRARLAEMMEKKA